MKENSIFATTHPKRAWTIFKVSYNRQDLECWAWVNSLLIIFVALYFLCAQFCGFKWEIHHGNSAHQMEYLSGT